MLSNFIRRFAMETGRGRSLYRRVASGKEYAEFLRHHGEFYAIGDDCYISPNANISDPAYVRIGNNVRINECAIFGHDGAVNMVNKAFGLRLDSVGKIDIRDNVYIGYGCTILQNVTIGPNAIVAAGSVVTRDVPEDAVVAGTPAKQVSTVTAYIENLKSKNAGYPWRQLIEQRNSEFDPAIEGTLVQQRTQYFYPTREGEGMKRLRTMPGIFFCVLVVVPVLFLVTLFLEAASWVERMMPKKKAIKS